MLNRSCIVCGAEGWIHGITADGESVTACRTHYDELHAWRNALDDQATAAAGGPVPQTCPRRMNELGPWEREDDLDHWVVRSNAYGNQRRSCSFCGSIHPDDFMRQVRDGAVLGTTSKSYKVYVPPNHDKFYFQHLSADQMHEFVALWNDHKVSIDYPWQPYPFFMRPVQS